MRNRYGDFIGEKMGKYYDLFKNSFFLPAYNISVINKNLNSQIKRIMKNKLI